MGRGEPGIVPGLTTQLVYFRQESGIRQPARNIQESLSALAPGDCNTQHQLNGDAAEACGIFRFTRV
jgi:hypothetical protein